MYVTFEITINIKNKDETYNTNFKRDTYSDINDLHSAEIEIFIFILF